VFQLQRSPFRTQFTVCQLALRRVARADSRSRNAQDCGCPRPQTDGLTGSRGAHPKGGPDRVGDRREDAERRGFELAIPYQHQISRGSDG